jgi:hypothetical protein
MKALKKMTKEELIQELTNTRKQLKGAREALDDEVKLRRSDVERTRSAMKDKLDTASCQYREWKVLAEKYQSELVEVQRDRDFFRRVLEKMSR